MRSLVAQLDAAAYAPADEHAAVPPPPGTSDTSDCGGSEGREEGAGPDPSDPSSDPFASAALRDEADEGDACWAAAAHYWPVAQAVGTGFEAQAQQDLTMTVLQVRLLARLEMRRRPCIDSYPGTSILP